MLIKFKSVSLFSNCILRHSQLHNSRSSRNCVNLHSENGNRNTIAMDRAASIWSCRCIVQTWFLIDVTYCYMCISCKNMWLEKAQCFRVQSYCSLKWKLDVCGDLLKATQVFENVRILYNKIKFYDLTLSTILILTAAPLYTFN